MTVLNNYQIIDRPNRPGVLQRVGLRALFINNGQLTDPYEISGVTIFNKVNNQSPSSLLNSEQEINFSAVSSVTKMNFGNSATLTSDSSFNPSNYTPGTTASGIYRLGPGDYVVVLDGSLNLSGNLERFLGYPSELQNTASGVRDYLDIWTVRHVQASKPTTVLQNFRLFDDTFIVLTERIQLEPQSRLINRRIRLGEVVDLKVQNDITVVNRNIDEATRNIFNQSVITQAQMKIEKVNESQDLPTYVEVSGYSDTSTLTEVTSDDIVIFNFDTNILTNWSSDDSTEQTKRNSIGSPRGSYRVSVKYTLLGETKITPPMFFTIS